MDNASKALRIAGAVLLGLMVTSLLLFAFNMWQKYKRADYQSIQNQQATKFNGPFDVYNKKALRGSDLVSLGNKVNSTNRTLAGKSDYATYGITDMNYKFPETELMPIRVFVAFTSSSNMNNFSTNPITTLALPGIDTYILDPDFSGTLSCYDARTYLSLHNQDNNDFPGANETHYYYVDLDEYVQKVYNNEKLEKKKKELGDEFKKTFKGYYFECTGVKFDNQTGRYCRLFYKQVFKIN